MPRRIPICPAGEVIAEKPRLATVEDVEIGIFRLGEQFVAYRNICPHQGAPVCQGRVSGTTLPSSPGEYVFGLHGGVLHCPWHGWQFNLETGEALSHRVRLAPIKIAVEYGVLVAYL